MLTPARMDMNVRQNALTVADIEDAAERIFSRVAQTPCLHSLALSKLTGAEVFVKFENFQFTASFKERGALTEEHVD